MEVVALGLVTLLMTGMIGLDLFFARRVGRDTEDILENSSVRSCCCKTFVFT